MYRERGQTVDHLAQMHAAVTEAVRHEEELLALQLRHPERLRLYMPELSR